MAVLAEAPTATTVAERLSATAEVEADATPEPEPGPERAAEHAAETDCLAIGTELSDASGAECLLSVREEAPDLPVVLFGPNVDANRGGTAGRTEYVTGDDPETVTERIAGVIDAWRDSDVVDLGETSVATVEGLLDGGAEGSDAFDRVPEPAVEYEHDDTPRVGAVNAAFESAFGVRAETVVGEPLDEVVFSVGSGDHAELLDGTAVEAELRCRTVEGVRTFLLRTTPPTDDDPGVALYTDISDYKSVEERYSALVQSSSDALFILDRQGIVDYVSPAAEEAFGYDPGALVGYPLTEYVHPEDRETVGELLSDPTGWAGETRSVTYRFRAENEWRTVESAARSRLYDPAVEGVVMNCRDVTERERYQRELERQNDRLEEFASVVSHDLRNPLNVAHGHLQNARLGLDDPDVDVDLATSLSEVATSMDRMEALVDELLTLARKGEDVEEPEPVGLASVWEDAVSTVDTDGVDTTVESDAGMLADRSRLRRAFENLLRNVVDHVDGEATVRAGVVTAEADAAGQIGDGTAVETAPTGIYVEDDGPGIPEPEREQIFEPRYTTRDEGTGFGLNIVRQIVEAHGWSVEVVDGSDGGARFEVTGVEFVNDGHFGG